MDYFWTPNAQQNMHIIVNHENLLNTHNIPCLMLRNFPFHMICDEMASGQDMGGGRHVQDQVVLIQITFLSYDCLQFATLGHWCWLGHQC